MNMWLVGAGYWGSKLVKSLKKFNVEADIIDTRDGQTINDITSNAPVMLATPLWQHFEQTCLLLERGHDVYVEKPMAETTQQIDAISKIKTSNQLLMVGHLFVHHPQIHEIKQYIANGTIGQLTHVTSRRLNWGIYQTKTDPLLSLATHDISILQTIVDSTVIADCARSWNYSNNSQPDRVWFSGTSQNGITFDIDVSWHWPTRIRQTVVLGTKGQIVWDQDANTITVAHNIIQDRKAVAAPTSTVLPYQYELSPLETELKHWIDCVKYRSQPSTGIQAAESVAKVIDSVKQLL